MSKKRETYIKPGTIEYPPKPTITTSRELIERLASDLVEMHNDTGINLEYWPAAREFVVRFYVGEEPIKPGRDWNGN